MTTIPQLEQQLAELQDQVAKLAAQQTDSLTPNYITIDPSTGQVSADFTGVIHALGLTLPAWETGDPTPDQLIAWERVSNGAIVAQLLAGYPGNIAALNLQALAQTSTGGSEATLNADDDTGASQAGVIVSQSSRGAEASVTVSAGPGSPEYTLIDEDGSSSFLLRGNIAQATQTGLVVPGNGNNFFYVNLPTNWLADPVYPNWFAHAMIGSGAGGAACSNAIVKTSSQQLEVVVQNNAAAATAGLDVVVTVIKF